jgi:Ca2+-dependent lipid-binding protein
MFAKLVVVGICVALAQSAAVEKAKLKIKVSGRNLVDKDNVGTSDPYYILKYSTDMGNSKTEIGRSDTITDQENPDWGNVFEFDFDRRKKQYLYFHVYDEDNLREDDNVGRVWINVADYVDKGQLTNANLDKGGYLQIKSADSTVDTRSGSGPAGNLPLPAGQDSATLKFKVSATNLPTKDDVGFIPGRSDPYVIIKYTEGLNGKEKDVGRTATVTSTRNPNWGDVMTFNWNKNKDQRLHFKIYDDDNLREDDKLGNGWIEVNDYVAHGQKYTLVLPKRGILTIEKA